MSRARGPPHTQGFALCLGPHSVRTPTSCSSGAADLQDGLSRRSGRQTHLTFATLHTNSAAQTITVSSNGLFAPQGQIRTQLSLVLEGICRQVLLPRTGGAGRVVATLRLWCPTRPSEPHSRRTRCTRFIRRCSRVRRSSDCRRSTSRWRRCISAGRSRWEMVMGPLSLKDELEQTIAREPASCRLGMQRPGAALIEPGPLTAPTEPGDPDGSKQTE